MADPAGAGARGNTFVVAAVLLPVVVAGFFLLASAVPRWTVPPPTHDLLIRVQQVFGKPKVMLDFAVRDGRVVATVRPLPAQAYFERWSLYLVDVDAGSARPIPVTVPESMEADAQPLELPIDAVAGLQVSSEAVAPDGYRFQERSPGGQGLVGGLFGMGRRRPRITLVNKGRVVSFELPDQDSNPYASAQLVGWIVSGTGG